MWVHLYQFALMLCPERFRNAYGPEMLDLFRQRLQRARSRAGMPAMVWCGCSGLCDVLITAFLQRTICDRSSIERGDPLIHRLYQNVRLTFRSMRRSPGFTVTVLATLALGTGITIAMFAVLNGVLLGPLPYPRSERLVSVNSIDPKFGAGAFAAPYLTDLRNRVHGADLIAGYSASWAHTLTGVGEPRVVTAAYVTDGLFELLGV